jgi:ABC-2 type transport system ATP-binding protein
VPVGRMEIDSLCKSFGQVVALRKLTFTVGAGELFGFVGSNGAGKTTTMRIILGVLAADSGQVRIGGKPVDLQMRRRIGYLPEERGLYPKMKAGEQLSYLARLHGLAPRQAAAAADAWLERLGVAARREEEVQKLSLGNQQRVQLAAALVHDPDVLVLDEPFAGLDPVAVEVMSQVLTEQAGRGVPVIFSSHQLDLVERLCHRVGIVHQGHMQACGTVEELRAGAASHLLVQVPDAPAGWAAGIPGITVVAESGGPAGQTVLELAGEADDQIVLKAALATGPVREFTRRRPSLTELFRHLVTEQGDAA